MAGRVDVPAVAQPLAPILPPEPLAAPEPPAVFAPPEPVAAPEPAAPPEPEPELQPIAPPSPAPAPVLAKIVQFPAPPPRPATVDLPRLFPAEPPAAEDELHVPDVPDEDDEPPARRAPRRLRLPLLATAGLLALIGLLVWQLPPKPALGPAETVRLTAALMPHSRGTAIQFNGRGSLLSTFGGDLFLSIPERLDYKKAMSFQGFDMASECGLIDPDIRAARVSPLGRFIWVASGPNGRERCLVDLETKTVTHDLPGRDPAYGLPYLVGWAGPQSLLMATQPPPARVARWWSVDVGSHRATAVDLPVHERVLPLATEGGPALLAGFDDKGEGHWSLTTYWLAGQTFNAIRTLKVTLPEGRRDAVPHHGAISPDKRYLLVALRSKGGAAPAATGSLLIVSLEDGVITPLDLTADPLVDQPMFWAPGVQDGHYRFYFNGEGPDGVVPLAGEMRVEPGG